MKRSQRIAHDLLLPMILLLAAYGHAEVAIPGDLAPNELVPSAIHSSAFGQAASGAQGALAVVQQAGQGMTGRIAQSGAELEAYIFQKGYANSASIEQIGQGNAALISQDGFGNEAQIEQTGGQPCRHRTAGLEQSRPHRTDRQRAQQQCQPERPRSDGSGSPVPLIPGKYRCT